MREKPWRQFMPGFPSQGRLLLAAILVLGAALRVEMAIAHAPVLASDGGEYARMAESLFNTHSLVGTFEGPETLYAPLYPVLTAGVMFALPNAETAAHVVSLLFGTALIVTVFFAALYVYGQRTAYICAALVAIHPFLVALSGSVYNESIYLTLLVASVHFGLRALELRRRRDFVLLGACLGLAYLTRVEAIVYAAVFIVALLTAGLLRKKLPMALLGSAMVLALLLALASPYVAFVYRHTGSVRLEAKWGVNYTMARNRLAGASRTEADYGIGRDLAIKGPLLAPSKFASYTPYPDTLADRLSAMVSMARQNAGRVYDAFLTGRTGSPVLLILAIIGLFRQPWNNRRFGHEAVLLGVTGSIVFIVLTSSTGEFRYFLAAVPLLILWAGKGIEELGQWFAGWEAFREGRPFRPGVVAAALQVCVVVPMLMLSARGAQREDMFVKQQSSKALAARDAGIWLAHYEPGPKRIAVRHAVIPYYAKGTMIGLPYADPDTSLRYVVSKDVDFVVLESQYTQELPCIGEWLAHGIPDDRARLIYDRANSNGDRVAIYRWQTTSPR